MLGKEQVWAGGWLALMSYVVHVGGRTGVCLLPCLARHIPLDEMRADGWAAWPTRKLVGVYVDGE